MEWINTHAKSHTRGEAEGESSSAAYLTGFRGLEFVGMVSEDQHTSWIGLTSDDFLEAPDFYGEIVVLHVVFAAGTKTVRTEVGE